MNMKTINKLLGSLFLIFFLVGCDEDFSDSTDFASSILPPSNVSANFNVTQDNTGLVTITPTADNALSFVVDFGDGSSPSSSISVGGNVQHTYTEGSHTVKVTAKGYNNLSASADVSLTVSFKAPENLVVEIANSETISKQVNVTATADYATMYEFHPGVAGVDPVTANNGESLTYQYAEAGSYNVKIVSKGAAIAVTEYEQEFEVTAIVQPVESAPTPKSRPANKVVSIYSAAYDNLADTDFYPNWGQTTQFTEFDLNGDKMLQYTNINYQGVQFSAAQDVSEMEFLHLDVWTADLAALEIYPISVASGEKAVTKNLTMDEWTSIDIPISDFTDQGLSMNDIHQFKFVGSPWNAGGFGTIFIDNLYFYKNSEVKLPIKFDEAEKFVGFNGTSFEIGKDPDNASNNVGSFTNTANEWEGASLALDQGIDLSVNKKIQLRFWSPDDAEHKVLMKLEGGLVDNPVEIVKTVSKSGWNTITYDFSAANYSWPNSGAVNASDTYSTLVLFIDGGSWVAGTYHVDDIVQVLPTSGYANGGSVITGFETLGTLSGFDGGDQEVVANPDTTGNSSDHVLKLVKNSGQTWAGSKYTVTDKFKLDAESKVRVKIWSPRAGLSFMMKFEDNVGWPDTTATAEVYETTTKDGEWEELVFDFSGLDTSVEWYNLVMFIDNGTVGDGSSNFTVYLDDITQI
jgi:plastocyanin